MGFQFSLTSGPTVRRLFENVSAIRLPRLSRRFDSSAICDFHGITHLSKDVASAKYQVDWLKGFKSDIKAWQPLLDSPAYSSGANVDIMGFEYPEDSVSVMPYYRHKTRERFFTPKHDGQDRVACAHSLGCYLTIEGLLDDNLAEQFVENYAGLALTNPFLGDKYHDKSHYRAYSWLFSKAVVGSTFIERKINGDIDEVAKEEYPTHEQSLMLHSNAKTLLERIRENGGLSKHLQDFPIIIMIGEDDPGCENDFVREFAELIGVVPMEYPTGHNTTLESEKAQADLTAWQDDAVRMRRCNRRLEPLSRLGFSLKGGTSALDAGASFA